MQTALYLIKHHRLVGPGWLLDRVAPSGVPHRLVTVTQPDDLPMAIECRGVLFAGQPLEAEALDRKDPLLRALVHFVRSLVGLGVPYLGIGRGAQILARAFLAKPLADAEAGTPVGPVEIPLRPEGKADSLLAAPGRETLPAVAVPTTRLALPARTTLLAGAPERPEAFRLGTSAWGIYPHPELTPSALGDWLSIHPDWLPAAGAREAVLSDAHARAPEQQAYAHGLMDRFIAQCRAFRPTPEPLAQIHLGPEHCRPGPSDTTPS